MQNKEATPGTHNLGLGAGLHKHKSGVPHPHTHRLRTGFREGTAHKCKSIGVARKASSIAIEGWLGVRPTYAGPLDDLRIAPERPSLTLLAPAKTGNRDKHKKRRDRLTEGAATTAADPTSHTSQGRPLQNSPSHYYKRRRHRPSDRNHLSGNDLGPILHKLILPRMTSEAPCCWCNEKDCRTCAYAYWGYKPETL